MAEIKDANKEIHGPNTQLVYGKYLHKDNPLLFGCLDKFDTLTEPEQDEEEIDEKPEKTQLLKMFTQLIELFRLIVKG